MRFLWASFGLLSLVLGILGAVVPLLPTVPFLLLAAFCFARSSEKLHFWLLNHATFGPLIKDWQSHGAINLRAKRLSTISIALVFGLSLAMGVGPLILGIQALVLGCVLVFIWSRPSY